MEYKGDIQGYPKEIVEKILYYQVKQGNPKDITVFEKSSSASFVDKGFLWAKTEENCDFWRKVISHHNFKHFFERYPKKELEILNIGSELILNNIIYKVTRLSNFYLKENTGRNHLIFSNLKLNKKVFTENILGYYIAGEFPYCKSLRDLTKLVNALKEEIINQSTKKVKKDEKDEKIRVTESNRQEIIGRRYAPSSGTRQTTIGGRPVGNKQMSLIKKKSFNKSVFRTGTAANVDFIN